MKNIYLRKLGLLVVLVGGFVFGQDIKAGFFDNIEVKKGERTEPTSSIVRGNVIINNGGTLIINGDLTVSGDVSVNNGGVLIVYGNLISNGRSFDSNGKVIIQGDFTSTSSNAIIKNNGDLVVGGKVNVSQLTTQGNSGLRIFFLTDTEPNGVSEGIYGGYDDLGSAGLNPVLMRIIENVIVPVAMGYQWVGNKGNNRWDSDENWTGNRVPLKTSNVRIKASNDNPIISLNNGTVEVNNLTIEAEAVLTLKPGSKLTVNGDLVIKKPGGLVLENQSGPDEMASLITNGSVNGEVRIELELPRDEWYYVSQPIKEAKSDIYALLDENGEFRTSEAWVNIHRANRWYRIAGNVAIAELEGLSLKYRVADEKEEANHTVSYTGELNNGSISRNFTKRQYYLFGNPYPSAINWQDASGWERNNIDGTIWYRTRVKGDMAFVTYNRFADPGARAPVYPDQGAFGDEEMLAYIPPLQSVWISSLGESSVSINNDARSHAPNGTFLKSSRSTSSTSNVIRIISENEHSYDGAVLYFSENADEDIDRGDSEKMFNESVNIPEVYTRVGGRAMAINGLPALVDHSYEIPLSVRNRIEGYVNLKFDLSKFSNEYEVLLRDEYEDVEINLREVNQYSYKLLNLGDNHDRFVLRFNPSDYTEDVSTSILEELASEGSTQINIVGVNGRAIVSIGRELLAAGAGKIEVYSIEGQKLSESEARTNKTFLVLPDQTGVYIVVVTASGERKVKKLLR